MLEVKRSRHLARGEAVDTPEAAMAFIARVAVPEATHNAWAYRIGPAYRFSDDGEPSGTAGKPILAAIDGQGLDGVAVVVTRWFGGIKLGAGGLVRAYGGAAAESLRTAPRRPIIALETIELAVGFAHLQALHAALAASGAVKLAERFDTEGLRVEAELPASAVDALEERLRDATRGHGRVYRRA
jgi:putative IMPACT (imprinted ancient) family translation regulator